MIGKEYLIDYMQNHNADEIYNLIKKIEHLCCAYTDSRGAFIEFLNNEDMCDSLRSCLTMQEIVQDKYGNWVIKTGE